MMSFVICLGVFGLPIAIVMTMLGAPVALAAIVGTAISGLVAQPIT